jgi:hypothetical protein
MSGSNRNGKTKVRCGDPECCTPGVKEGRVLEETGELLQTDDGWHLESHENDDGPVIYHHCGHYVVDLNRRFTMCRSCGATIPPSMISGFTLLNWNKADDEEYFVHTLNEVTDFIYNGHLNNKLRGLGGWDGKDEDIDMYQVDEAIAAWKKETGVT